MSEELSKTDLVQGLSADRVRRLETFCRLRRLRNGEYLFLLGDTAQYLSVVVEGRIDLCFPMHYGGTVKDVTIESVGSGQTVGWSALVKPYRFTLSARAVEPAQVMDFGRHDLLQMFDSDPEIGRVLMSRISEIASIRLATFQALWVRELQRSLEAEASGLAALGRQPGAGVKS
jgi:CRP-like cAMP-binding protein